MKVDPEKYWDNVPHEIHSQSGEESTRYEEPRLHPRAEPLSEGNRKEIEYGD